MPKQGSPCPRCGAPLRRKIRTGMDWRPQACSTPDCENYSEKPSTTLRFSSHCPEPNILPAKTDWHEMEQMRYAIVGCGSAKRESQLEPGKLIPKKWPASELYTSTFFGKKWDYAGLFDGRVVLSAEHGILYPDEEIEPYDTTIEDLTESQLAALADEVNAEIEEWAHFETDLAEVQVLAGKRYIEPLRERGAFDVTPEVTFPLQEHDLCGIGEQMAWLGEQASQQQTALTDGGAI